LLSDFIRHGKLLVWIPLRRCDMNNHELVAGTCWCTVVIVPC